MPSDTKTANRHAWQVELPQLAGRIVTLREVAPHDVAAVAGLLSLSDASRFGIDDVDAPLVVDALVDRAVRDRTNGVSFTYAITLNAAQVFVGLAQVRQLDPRFEAAEWECTLTPSVRGTGIFVEAARLVGSFVFGTVGAHRLEARVPVQNGRANGALRKLGAVQEGVLRSSARKGQVFLDQVLWSVLRDDWGRHWVSAAPRVH